MSDDKETTTEHYQSQVDPLFAEAWNQVFDPAAAETPVQSGDEAGLAPAGDQASTPSVEGAGAEHPATPAPVGGTEPPQPGETDSGDSTGNVGSTPVEAYSSTATRSFVEVAPLLDLSAQTISENAERSFRQQAVQEVNAEIGPKYDEALRKPPYLLVGERVPDLRGGSEPVLLRDSADAREWQEAAKTLIEAEIQSRVASKTEEVKPMLSVIQESLLMFRNNPDLMPNTKEFDKQLADRIADLAGDYELRVNGKLYGYQVDVQPLINKVRAQLNQERGAAGATTNRQQQVAQQPRQPNGQFDGPQAGIPSKAGTSGEAGDDYSAFWDSMGMKGMIV